jgi:nitrogen fixation NifU-like protein
MTDDLKELYQQLLLDHNKSPRNFRVLANANRTAQGTNPICGDNCTIYARLDGEVVQDISFQGSGCAISIASASLLTEIIKGKNKAEVKEMFDQVSDMLTTGHSIGDLGKLSALAGVHRLPVRIKCAILPWHALAAAVEGRGEIISTESDQK